MTDRTLTHLLSLQELALRCDVDTAFVEQLEELGVIESHSAASGHFASEVTLRVRRCVRLQRDLGVNLEGVAVVVELLDRIETLEQELHGLRQRW